MHRFCAILVLLSACATPPGRIVGERVEAGQEGWSVPPHTCENGQANTVANDDGTISQFCDVYGRTTGRFLRWHPNGQKATEGKYSDGERHGSWVWWHENSQLAARGEYINGQPLGVWSWWHQNGQLETQGDHLSGNRMGEWRTWYPSGQLKATGQYRNDTKNGAWKVYTQDGEVGRTEQWDLGRLRSHKALVKGWELATEAP
ncbi:MAG: toxin-antitoxin system YwqK family antitoxin [Myxococcota bacterium]